MSSRRVLRLLPAVLVCCVAASWWAGAQEKTSPPPAHEFDGKFLSVATKSDPEHGRNLEKVQVKKLGNAFFLAGVGADAGGPDNWQKGLAVWIALDDVSEIVVFPTLDALKKAMELAERRT